MTGSPKRLQNHHDRPELPTFYIMAGGRWGESLFGKFLFLYTYAAKSSTSTMSFLPLLLLPSEKNTPQKTYSSYWHWRCNWKEKERNTFLLSTHLPLWLPLTKLARSHFRRSRGNAVTKDSFLQWRTEQKRVGGWIWEQMPDEWHGLPRGC